MCRRRALAAVATTGYLGFLAGPPLIGAVAQAAGLAAGLGLVSGACAFVALRAGALPAALGAEDSTTKARLVSPRTQRGGEKGVAGAYRAE